jgi:hypothetical protein
VVPEPRTKQTTRMSIKPNVEFSTSETHLESEPEIEPEYEPKDVPGLNLKFGPYFPGQRMVLS